MKAYKTFLKPVRVILALIGIGMLMLIKSTILGLKINFFRSNITNINAAIQKLLCVVFNPYRISNGIRPVVIVKQNNSISNIERCHEIIASNRLAKSS